MKTETILNKLLKLKENPYNSELLDNVINELKIDVYNENMGLKIERALPDKKFGEIVNVNFKDIIAKLKAKQIEEKDGIKLIELKSENYKCLFNADNLKKICDILGTTELVMRLYGEMKAALVIDEKSDNQVVIVPIRSYC